MTGYALVSGACVTCDTNCTAGSCITNGSGKCDTGECKDGFGLTSTFTCTACAANCSICDVNGAG